MRAYWSIILLFLGSQMAFSNGAGPAVPKDYFELTEFSEVVLDMRYASTNNFLNENIYGDFTRAFLHRDTKVQFAKITAYLKIKKPGWKLLIFDALRPHSMQKKLWAKVEGTDEERYVMNPKYGSIHSFGFALDLSLLDAEGHEVDMGTGFDSFVRMSQPKYEDEFFSAGKLSRQQLNNRKLLREIMGAGGFKVIPNEWWHFEAQQGSVVRKKYPLFDR